MGPHHLLVKDLGEKRRVKDPGLRKQFKKLYRECRYIGTVTAPSVVVRGRVR